MRSIAIINQKGGVGKTTTAVNLAAALARRGQRVLLVDLDPQANATQHLGIELADGDSTLYDVIVHGAPLAGVLRYASEQFAIAPSHIDLVGAEIEMAEHSHREFALRNALTAHYDHFDMIVVDCAPSLGVLTVNALAAVEEVFIPLQPHFFALQGLGKLIETVTLVRQGLNPRLRVSGVLLCMYEHGTRLGGEVTNDVRSFFSQSGEGDIWRGARVFETHIRRNIKLAEAPSFGKSIFDYDAQCHGATDYDAVAVETLAMNGEFAGQGSGSADIPAHAETDEPPSDGESAAPPSNSAVEQAASGGAEDAATGETSAPTTPRVDQPPPDETTTASESPARRDDVAAQVLHRASAAAADLVNPGQPEPDVQRRPEHQIVTNDAPLHDSPSLGTPN